jgi:hypothetical protein
MVVMEPYELISGNKFTSDAGPTSTYDPTEWANHGVYAQGATVKVTSAKKVYEALVDIPDSTTSPPTDVLAAVPKWAEISYMNIYKCFDYTRSSLTKSSNTTGGRTTMIVTITPGVRFDSLFVYGIYNVEEIVINGTSPTQGNVYNTTKSNLISGYEDHVDIFNIPPITDLVLTLTLKAPVSNTSEISVKTIAVGKAVYIGSIQTSNKLDNVNYSVVTRDEFGIATLVPRRSILKLDFTLFLESKYVDRTVSVRESLNAVPAIWYAMEEYSVEEYNNVTIILGIYKNFRIQLDTPYSATVNLELEEI